MAVIVQLMPILLILASGTTSAFAKDQLATTMDSLLNAENLFPANQVGGRTIQIGTTGKALLKTLQRSLQNRNILETMYENYQQLYGKSYKPGQILKRMTHFKNQLIEIAKHNIESRDGKATFEKGVNLFTDMTNDELKQYTGLKYSNKINAEPVPIQSLPPLSHPCNLPNASFCDWRSHNAVSPIKNQGQCGSCAYFAATATLESAHFLNHGGDLLDLSEQELLDCGVGIEGYGGCGGNYLSMPMKYMMTYGLTVEDDYSYETERGECRSGSYNHPAKVNNWSYVVPQGDEKALQEAVRVHGPIMVGIHVSQDFLSYQTGVFSEDYSGAANHAVLVVGYGTDKTGIDYWIVKNSWGTGWGNQGYILMRRNYNNMCHIADVALAISG